MAKNLLIVESPAKAKTIEGYLGKDFLVKSSYGHIRDLAKGNNIFSIKVDTNFDNIPMLKILEKLGYTYCGEVTFRGSFRKAFEKTLPVS